MDKPTIVRLEDTEAKLRGGYAPTKVDHTHTVRDALDDLLDELEGRPAMTPDEATRLAATST